MDENNRLYFKVLLFIVIIGVAAGCSLSFGKAYPNIVAKYKKLEPNKALAVAMDANGAYAFGYGSNYNSIKQAKRRALKECRTRREKLKVHHPCKLYMVNNKRVNTKD